MKNVIYVIVFLIATIGCNNHKSNHTDNVSSTTQQQDDKYSGNWVDVGGRTPQILITKNGNSYLVKMNYGDFRRGQLPATYNAETGLLTMNAEGMQIQLPIDNATGYLLFEGMSFKKSK